MNPEYCDSFLIVSFQGINTIDLEEKLKALSLLTSAADDAVHIERIKSRSPIDPQLGTMGAKTFETLREIERNREYQLNEQGQYLILRAYNSSPGFHRAFTTKEKINATHKIFKCKILKLPENSRFYNIKIKSYQTRKF
jgi:hypothetical protein